MLPEVKMPEVKRPEGEDARGEEAEEEPEPEDAEDDGAKIWGDLACMLVEMRIATTTIAMAGTDAQAVGEVEATCSGKITKCSDYVCTLKCEE